MFLNRLLAPVRGLLILAFSLMALLSACQSKTDFRSSDPDATLVLEDGREFKGDIVYRDRKPAWGVAKVEIKKDGCETRHYEISKFDDFSLKNFLIAGITYGAGLIWITEYRPEYTLQFDCVKEAQK